jgi:hypothetical protein
MVASALFQPLYNPNPHKNDEEDSLPLRQLSVLSDSSEVDYRSPDIVHQVSSLSAHSDRDGFDDKASLARNRIISRAPRPSLLMMTPNTAYNKMRRSYEFAGASLRRSLLISVHLHPNSRSKVLAPPSLPVVTEAV